MKIRISSLGLVALAAALIVPATPALADSVGGPPPSITGVTAPAVIPGMGFGIYTQGLTDVSRVTIGGRPAQFAMFPNGVIATNIPAGYTGGEVRVDASQGSFTRPLELFFASPVDRFQGHAGDTITLTGNGFSGVNFVYFRSGDSYRSSEFTVIDDHTISLTAPEGVRPGDQIVLSDDFALYQVPNTPAGVPSITSVQLTPSVNPTVAVIAGTGIYAATKVTFGGYTALPFSIDPNDPDKIDVDLRSVWPGPHVWGSSSSRFRVYTPAGSAASEWTQLTWAG